ncbi:acyltransferase family protein [Microbulbifer epialgicus]|uniref:Acyltransferase family protein n=1 Tax=Microbulbifer epialgicus TaxID=393907 RepID=A0ABV4NU63_9GAMM
MKRIGYFDGLRGVAALVVVNEHLLKLFFALAFSDAALRAAGSGIIEQMSFPPFNMLHNGAWAVCIFFVLSGYVLSYSFFKTASVGQADLVGKVAARYLRLAIPVTASLIFVWVLMLLGAFQFEEVALITQSQEINQYGSIPTFTDIFKQGFGSALFLDDLRYNPPLWTMSVEMIGSIGIFLFQAIFLSFQTNKYAFEIRIFIYFISIVLIFPTLYTGFILGMMLCDIQNNEKTNKILEKYSKYWVPFSLIIGVMLCAYMIRGLYTNPYKIITIQEFHPYHEYLYNTWGAFFLIAGMSYSKKFVSILGKAIPRFIGRISFSLYLTHYTVMSSLTAYLYLYLPFDNHVAKVFFAIALSLPVMFLVAYFFDKLVNKPTIIAADFVKRRLILKIARRKPNLSREILISRN